MWRHAHRGSAVSPPKGCGRWASLRWYAAGPLVDVALADGLSGTTVGAHLAQQGVAVIYLTGHVDEAVRDGRAHAVDILPKPYGPADRAESSRRGNTLQAARHR